MKLTTLMICIILFFVSTDCMAQIQYPFMDNEVDRDILAYWYNIPNDSYQMFGDNKEFYSSLQIYGKTSRDLLRVKAQVYLGNGEKVFDHVFNLTDNLFGTGEKLYEFVEVSNHRCEKIRLKSKKVVSKNGNHKVKYGSENKHYWFSKETINEILSPDINNIQKNHLSISQIKDFEKEAKPVLEYFDYKI